MTNPSTEQSTSSSSGSSSGNRRNSGGKEATRGDERAVGALNSDYGTTTIAEVVVQKIAAMATREVSGVRELGGSASRTFGAIRERIPGAGTSSGQGVTVEVGERQAAIDVELLVDYGVAIADLAKAVRKNVMTAIERMTGLEVVEVNINVTDVYLGENEDQQPSATGGGGQDRVE